LSDTLPCWTGDNMTEVVSFIGHDACWHKHGVLIVQNARSLVFLSKDSALKKAPDGTLMGNVSWVALPIAVRNTLKNLPKRAQRLIDKAPIAQ
jgi:hypothetical protein